MSKAIHKAADSLYGMLNKSIPEHVSVGIGANNTLLVYVFEPANIPANMPEEYFGFKVDAYRTQPPKAAA